MPMVDPMPMLDPKPIVDLMRMVDSTLICFLAALLTYVRPN